MKKTTLSSIALIFTATLAFSQDVIVKKSGEEIKSKVVEVTATEVKYKKFDDQKGPTFSLIQSELASIQYENGTKDMFFEEAPVNPSFSSTISDKDLFNNGQRDAVIHYKGYRGASTGTLIVGLLSPIVGLIPAIACSSTKPKDQNLNYPSAELMQKAAYQNGYTRKAKKIKQGKVWSNLGIAFGANLVAVLILSQK